MFDIINTFEPIVLMLNGPLAIFNEISWKNG